LRTEIFLSSIILLGLLSVPAFADKPLVPQGLALNHPGIKWDWNLKAGNYTFDVVTVSNYDMKNVTFNHINKELIFTGNSTYTDNIAEIEIPHNLIGGNLTVAQNGKAISTIIIPGKDSYTIILKFNQTGPTTTTVVGTTYLPEFSGIAPLVMMVSFGIVLFTLRVRKF